MKKRIAIPNEFIISGFFLISILLGSFLLSLPISSASHTWTPYIDALFTSTTSICVTGLVTVTTATTWSLFGKLVILFLIQIGGLGIVTVVSAFYLGFRKRATLSAALLLGDALNSNTPQGIRGFLKNILIYTFSIEFGFALLFLPTLIKKFGSVGLFYAIFHSISTFCNAGIDIFGLDSLYSFSSNSCFLIFTMLEIIIGGIGFVFLIELLTMIKNRFSGEKKVLSLHAKLVLVTTLILIFGGAILIFALEYSNPGTIGNMSLKDKIVNSFFESVTFRTAGFATFSQAALNDPTVLLARVLMFIGGSPTGTAGGVKTVTIAILVLSSIFSFANRDDLIVLKRRIRITIVKKAICIFVIALLINLVSVFLGMNITGCAFREVSFEVVSALATVGLSMDFTATLNVGGKILITICMFLGRIAPFSLLLIFSNPTKKNVLSYAEEDIVIG